MIFLISCKSSLMPDLNLSLDVFQYIIPEVLAPESAFSSSFNLHETPNLPAGISARRPEISLRASAQREVESAIMLTLYPMSLKYSDSVIPAKTNRVSVIRVNETLQCNVTYASDQRVCIVNRYLCRWRLLWQLQACWRCWPPVPFSSWCSPSSRPPPWSAVGQRTLSEHQSQAYWDKTL